MLYQYQCFECGSITEYQSEFGQAADPNWEPPDQIGCSECGEQAHFLFNATPLEAVEDQTELKTAKNPFSGSRQFQLVGGGYSRQDMRLNEHIAEIDRVMEGPVTPEEVEVGMELMAMREQEKGLPEGQLSGERPTEDVVMKEISHDEKERLEAQQREQVEEVLDQLQDGLIQHVTPDQVEDFQEGRETVVTKRAVKRGAEDMKRRAEEQRQSRQG